MNKYIIYVILIIGLINVVKNAPLPECNADRFHHLVIIKLNSKFICTGSIISNKYILTAAHSLINSDGEVYSPEVLEVVVAINDLNGRTIHNISQVIVHEEYRNHTNDIALLKLSRPLEFSVTVKPVELYTGKIEPGSEINYSKLDRKYHIGSVVQTYKCRTAKLMPVLQCKQNSGISVDGILCLERPKQNGICEGDSGGSALLNGKLVGVTNFFINNCNIDYPDGYANVFFYINWIKNNSDLIIC